MSVIIYNKAIPNFNGIFLDPITDFYNFINKPIQNKTKDNIGNQFPEIIKF